MRIAYVCADPGVPIWGSKGASVHVQEMLRALVRAGHDLTVLTPRPEGTRPADLSAVKVRQLPPAPKGKPAARARKLLAANKELWAILDQSGSDLVYERHALYTFAATEWAASAGVPSVLEVNAPLLREQTEHRTLALADEATAGVYRAMQAATLTTAVTKPVADHAHEMGARDVIVVPNAIDPDRFQAAAPLASQPYTVGFLGSLKRWHGLPTLADAFSQLYHERPETRLLIIGDGPERATIENALNRLNIGNAVEFTGLLPASDVPAALVRLDVGTAPYSAQQDFYFSPLKIYEYMAAGLPVVTSDTGHLREIVNDRVTGLIVPPDDPNALSTTLMRLADDPSLGRRLGEAGRAHVFSEHTWSGTAAKVLARAFANRRAA
ncbi:glycosyltransferase family 4 protein [Cognatiyoonia sp. IB215182]|uniref:glycosyltransferase family 4 protein n=1 Tax=Cognatiyoonia sp. IB215182 TaxID=3097353 RepID=UPI002A11C16B|nr:glycosyltransferase family 4 protein [Cognatiyoonia sp. IB215182]MDX8355651.1 glycosyltransferase family 4 protein [Cognatiyoonia sp. IB215182]